MPYRVTAPLVLVHDQSGSVHYHYRDCPNLGAPTNYGDTIPWLSDAEAEFLLASGLIERIEPDVSDQDTSEAGPGVLHDCLKALEHLGVDLGAGAPTARTALREGGHRFANDIVAAAVKARKDAVRALSGTAA